MLHSLESWTHGEQIEVHKFECSPFLPCLPISLLRPLCSAMRALGRSFLPGHEEETFQPRINPRSAALQRGDSSRIYDRLFDMAASKKPVDALGATDAGEAGQRDASGYPVDEAGEPAPGHPHYFNLVAWESSAQMDLVLRRLLRSDVQ
jgi:hypothetical protein